jgi:hypothetical protein
MLSPTLADRLAELQALAADCEAGSPPAGRTVGRAIILTSQALDELAASVAALEQPAG